MINTNIVLHESLSGVSFWGWYCHCGHNHSLGVEIKDWYIPLPNGNIVIIFYNIVIENGTHVWMFDNTFESRFPEV
jgi:hypothetical protein